MPIQHFRRERPSNRARLRDVGAGTGYYLAAVLARLPQAEYDQVIALCRRLYQQTGNRVPPRLRSME